MHFFRPLLRRYPLNLLFAVAALALVAPKATQAEALLLVEASTGKVLQADNATYPWHPASLTKLMTAYVTLKAVKDGKLTMDTLLTVSPVAAGQSPSKMGFRPGTQVTVDNALKMMLVKSANDMAVVLAEGVGGSVEGFSALMNQTARQLGMTQTNYVNPNGLPDDAQITSARDLAILARSILRDLPEYESYMHIPAIRFGRRVTQNFNRLIGRYPGADGFKTGFICASGYNLVASATRNGKRLIAVVLGASSGQARAVKAAQLLERGFSTDNALSWLRPTLGTVDNLAPIDAPPPDLRDQMCNGRHKRPASDEDADTLVSTAPAGSAISSYAAGQQPSMIKASELLAFDPIPSEPVPVYTGPTKTGAALIAAVEADADKPEVAHRRGRKLHAAGSKRDAGEKAEAKPQTKHAAKETVKETAAKGAAKDVGGKDTAKDAKPKSQAKSDTIKSDTKSAKPGHTNAKPNAAQKPAAAANQSAAKQADKPAKPKATAKPAAKPGTKNTNGNTAPAS